MRVAGSFVFVCGYSLTTAASENYIQPDIDTLREGRDIWLSTCESCHGYGTADAPIPMRPEDWRTRVNKARSELYTHAIEGFIGPDYSMMPARGGNDALSDSEVEAAVDYMLFLANYYIEKDKQFIKQDRGEK